MEQKDLVDLLSKKANVIYKKIIILLAVSGGIGSYALIQSGILQLILFMTSSFFVFGIIINYFELNTIKKKFDTLEENYND